jgi:N-dimethylarginine dimethylaminohydrolase
MSKTILMCPPTYFDIEYEINPWMHASDQVDVELAKKQWSKLEATYRDQLNWQVELINPVKGLPDMVFTANGALVIGGKVALPTFRQPDRQPETTRFKTWFVEHGYSDFLLPKYDFEGEGDALVWNDLIFIGYPWRSDLPSHREIADFFGKKVVSLQLADARFYHLDTCLTIVDDQTVAVWPGAFSKEALAKLHELVPRVVEASEADAIAYGLNAMSDGKTVILSDKAHGLIATYQNLGINCIGLPIGEFQKSGGGVKCLTLELGHSEIGRLTS